MRLSALHSALSCECCAQELDVLHDVLVTSDISIAKALMISEVAQIARLEMRMRDYMALKWRNRMAEASRAAGAMVKSGAPIKSALASVDKIMGKWAQEVEPRLTSDLAGIYKLARAAGTKKATGKTKASLQYVVPNFTAEIEAGNETGVNKARRRTAEVVPAMDVLDDDAISDLQGDQMVWVGRHYAKNVRDTIRRAVTPAMVEGVGHDEAGKRVAAALLSELGKVTVPKGFNGSAEKYFEGIAANTATNARVRGQVRSFSDVGVTTYEIVNPMDSRTTEICAFMNGTIFTVKDANAQLSKTSAAKNPQQVKDAHPWLSAKKAKSIGAKGPKALAKAGLALPPYHFRCRSTVDVSIESMDFANLGGAQEEPKQQAPAAPRVPSTRLGAQAEALFGKKLTDAELDSLVGANAKLPPGYALKETIRDYSSLGKNPEPRLAISAGILDDKQKVIGTFNRIYKKDADGKLEVKHVAFFLDKKVQNSGIGRELFNAQVEAYRKLGIDKVTLDAAEVGKYVWAKAGFEWTDPKQVKHVFEKLEAKVARKIGAAAAKKVMSQLNTAEDVARLVVDGERIGKDFLIDKGKKVFRETTTAAGHLLEMSQSPDRIKLL